MLGRALAWMRQNRRISKDHERLPENFEAFVCVPAGHVTTGDCPTLGPFQTVFGYRPETAEESSPFGARPSTGHGFFLFPNPRNGEVPCRSTLPGDRTTADERETTTRRDRVGAL